NSASSRPSSAMPVSSVNSRRAAASGSSPESSSPLAIDQAPRSFFAQKGPPGCTRKNSGPRPVRRNGSRPALVLRDMRELGGPTGVVSPGAARGAEALQAMLQLPSRLRQARPLTVSLRPSLSVTVSVKLRQTSPASRDNGEIGVTVPPLPVLGFSQLQVLPAGASDSAFFFSARSSPGPPPSARPLSPPH